MTKPAFLVDGHTEQRITQRICPGAPVRMLNLNGRDVEISAIAKLVASQYRLLGNRYHPVVVIIDREDRAQTAAEVKETLLRELLALGVPSNQLIVGVADRMIENWILADSGCTDLLKDNTERDGCHGKSVLKTCLSNGNTSYHGTTLGVDLFCKINPAVAASNSASFRAFAEQIKPFCEWIGRSQQNLDLC